MPTIRFVLADDHSVVRRNIREFLNDAGDIQVVAEAGDGTEAVKLANQHHPDVIVLDLRLPGENGIEVTRHLRLQMPTPGILMLGAFDDPLYSSRLASRCKWICLEVVRC
ncbi:MAG: response regulator transcription factor [Anaerolineae bacterium]|nr:response regulator transcription factor [Anaerolineae bacterium]